MCNTAFTPTFYIAFYIVIPIFSTDYCTLYALVIMTLII